MQRKSLPCGAVCRGALLVLKGQCKWPAFCKASFWWVRQAPDLQAPWLGCSVIPKGAGGVLVGSAQPPTFSASRCLAVQLADAPC